MSEEIAFKAEGTVRNPKNPFTESEAKNCVLQEISKQETGSSCVWKVFVKDTNGTVYPLLIKGLSADINKADFKTAVINKLTLTNKITPTATSSSIINEDDDMGLGGNLS